VNLRERDHLDDIHVDIVGRIILKLIKKKAWRLDRIEVSEDRPSGGLL